MTTIAQMQREEALQCAEDWRAQFMLERARANRLSLQVCALNARCSELLALFKDRGPLTPTGEMVVKETEALLRMTR